MRGAPHGTGGEMVDAARLDTDFAGLTPQARLAAFRAAVPGRIIFTTSFGIEDQMVTHLIAQARLDITLATLDTGRLFPETYALWAETEARYGLKITPYAPEASGVEAFIRENGINGFYAAPEARRACCAVRKVHPLARALDGAAGWITGLRADQSANRAGLAMVSRDEARGLIKLNPLFDLTRADIAAFCAKHHVPVNPLHERGFLSIGCAPCTRALEPGEPERAGRWWWEEETKKECGLHIGADGKLTRGVEAKV
jgi:phosphoadenosine phosphosulfate reductase